MGGEGKNIFELLNLAHARVGFASCLAWVLDPAAEHGLGDRALRSLGQALAREAVHLGTLADREGTLAASRQLRKEGLEPPHPDVQVDELGAWVRVPLGEVTLRLLPCLGEPPPGTEETLARRGRGTLVALTLDGPPGETGERPAPAVWPLGELARVLRVAPPRDAQGHLVAQLREWLEARCTWLPAELRPAVPVAPRPRAPGASAALPTAPAPAAAPVGAGAEEDWLLKSMLEGEPPPQPAPAVEPSRAPAPAPAARPVAAPAHERHADLDQADQVEGERAVLEALAALQKALHFFRLYPQEHPNCVQAIEHTFDPLQRFIERHGALELQIERDGVAFRGKRIAEEQGRATDLSFLLYPEGIRSLTFDVGIEPNEVHQLVETLAGEAAQDQDLLGALWRRELTHMNYLTYDQLSPSGLKTVHDATLAPVARRIASLAVGMHKSTLESDAQLEALLTAPTALAEGDPALLATHAERSAEYRATPAGASRQELFDRLHDPFLGDLLARAADTVAWCGAQEDHEPDALDVAHFHAGSVVNALWQGDLSRAGDLLQRAAASGPLHPELVQRLTAREGLALVVRALRPTESAPSPSREAAEAALRYFAGLGPLAVPPLCRLWGRLADPDVRQILQAFLATQASAHADALVPLTEHAEPALAAQAVDLFIASARDPRCKAVLERFAADASQPARQKRAADALDALSGDGERKRLLQALEASPDRDERVAAARKLAEAGNAQTFERLCALTQQREFPQKDDEELSAVLGTVTRLGGVRAVRVLQDLIEKKSLLGRKDTQRVAQAATACLEELKRKTRRPP